MKISLHQQTFSAIRIVPDFKILMFFGLTQYLPLTTYNKDYVKLINLCINNQLVILKKYSLPVSQPTVVT